MSADREREKFNNPFGCRELVVKFLQREALEARPRRSEHCQGGGRRLHYLDSAQRAVQSGGASRKPTGTGRECAVESRFRRAMWPRETTARSGDIVGGIESSPAKPMSSGFAAQHCRLCRSEKPRLAAATSLAASDRHWQKPMSSGFAAESTAVCARAKNTKSLAARAGGCGASSQPMPGANAMWNTAGQVLLGDVAARDVQAATSPANRIAPARTKSWRFAGGGLGSGGENRRGKGQVFGWPSE